MLFRRLFIYLLTAMFGLSQGVWANETAVAAGESAGRTVTFTADSQTQVFSFQEADAAIKTKCDAAAAELAALECNDKLDTSGTTGKAAAAAAVAGPGGNNTANGATNLGMIGTSGIEMQRGLCTTAKTTKQTACQAVDAIIEKQVAECKSSAVTFGNMVVNTILTPPMNACADAVCKMGYAKRITKVQTVDHPKNIGLCTKEEQTLLAKVKASIGKMTGTEMALLGAAAIGIAMLAKNMMDNDKSAKDFASNAAPTTTTTPTTTAKDESCKAGDYNCLCKGGRAERPVACDSSCAFSMGKPNSTCLAKRYGSDWESKYLDPTGQVITGSGNSEYQVTENSNNGQTAAAYTGGRSGSGTIRGGSAESAEMGKNDNGRSQTAVTASGTDLSLSSAGGSSLNMSSPYASGLPNREMASTGSNAADAERAQIAAKSTNLFGNVTRVYRRYSVEMMN